MSVFWRAVSVGNLLTAVPSHMILGTVTPSERVKIIKAITPLLAAEQWPLIDLTLRQFKLPKAEMWEGNNRESYVIQMVSDASDGVLVQLASHLGIESLSRTSSVTPSFWLPGHLRLFITHLAKHKKQASLLQERLLSSQISSFIAHKDIEPTKGFLFGVPFQFRRAEHMCEKSRNAANVPRPERACRSESPQLGCYPRRFRAIVTPVWLHSWLHFGAKLVPFLMEKSGSMLESALFSDAAESPIGSAILRFECHFSSRSCKVTHPLLPSANVITPWRIPLGGPLVDGTEDPVPVDAELWYSWEQEHPVRCLTG